MISGSDVKAKQTMLAHFSKKQEISKHQQLGLRKEPGWENEDEEDEEEEDER